MIILACETSTLLGSVAIIKDGHILCKKELLRQGSHSEMLNTFIADCLASTSLQLCDIDVFVTGLGPGSFTGLRISLNTIKTLAYVNQKPVWGCDSLLNLAFENKKYFKNENILKSKKLTSMINAYKNMVYIAEYEILNLSDSNTIDKTEIIEIKPPQVVRVQELDTFITENTWTFGDGFEVFQKYFSENLKSKCLRLQTSNDHPTAESLGLIASLAENQPQYYSWEKLVPIYLRASEAEEVKAGIKYQAL